MERERHRERGRAENVIASQQVEAFLDEIVLAVLIKFHNRMFSAQMPSLVLDFITETDRAKPL